MSNTTPDKPVTADATVPAAPAKAPAAKAPAKKAAAKAPAKAPAAKAPAKKAAAVITTLPDPQPAAEPRTISVISTVLSVGSASYQLPEGATLRELMVAAGLSDKKFEPLINSRSVPLDTVLTDAVNVIFSIAVKGG